MDIDKIRQLQPTINVGMIGSVSNGKSSLTYKLTGVKTQKHSAEQLQNITMKLGYANAKIYKCPQCPPPQCYQSSSSAVMQAFCKICNHEMLLEKHISFVDCPGHNLLMATMLNGTCVMDSSIIIEAVSNKEMPASQTIEHLIAAEIMELDTPFICMNKIDTVSKSQALKQIEKFESYMQNLDQNEKEYNIIPISANFGINIDIVCEHICKLIKEPIKDLEANAKMIVIRSFNINHQNTQIKDLQGGVVGGSLVQGVFHVGDSVEILPGFIMANPDKNTKWAFQPVFSVIESINSEKNNLEFAVPGGLIGVKLGIDPALTVADGLVGSILIKSTNTEHNNNYKIMEVLYVIFQKVNRDTKLKKDDILIINYNACNIKGQVKNLKKDKMEIELISKPICVQIDDFITISKPTSTDMRNIILLGRAQIKDGKESTIMKL